MSRATTDKGIRKRFHGDVLRNRNASPTELAFFRSKVWGYWKKNGRHDLPWRKTKDPYKILVSEVMLQQTQVSRVIPKYKEFLKAFPTVKALAGASLADVLRNWNGLGYNRRAKYLHDAAKQIVLSSDGRHIIVPRAYDNLRTLPGIGDYTAQAIRVFAFNRREILIETNIRSAIIHHFFPAPPESPTSSVAKSRMFHMLSGRTTHGTIHDRDLLPIIERLLKHVRSPREWYSALMDYGAHIKQIHPNPSRKSRHHMKQSKFEGSLRQVRGAILRELAMSTTTEDSLRLTVDADKRFSNALASLCKEGLVEHKNGFVRLALG